jgi:hypothetical protein
MTPASYHAFFSGCASVAGTLIGLLFVAISVTPHKHLGTKAPLAFQIQAGIAFTTLIDALIIALTALLPGTNLGTTAVVLAAVGISSTIGMTILALRHRPARHQLWILTIIPGLGSLFALQLHSGISLLSHPSNTGPVDTQALLILAFFVIAIVCAWQMIGVQITGLLTVLGTLLRERSQPHPTRPAQRVTRPKIGPSTIAAVSSQARSARSAEGRGRLAYTSSSSWPWPR